MHRFFLTKEQLNNCIIDGEEFIHAVKVLRLGVGADFVAIAGDQNNYFCKITSVRNRALDFVIEKTEPNAKNPQKQIVLYEALAKGEKLELVTQKITEIGASKLVPIYLTNCDVKPNTTKTSRLAKITESACKQCGRSIPVTIDQIKTLDQILPELATYDVALFANEKEQTAKLDYNLLKGANSVAIIVGPEGGFTDAEIQELSKVSTSISLGSRILRTETACIFLVSVVTSLIGA